MTHYDQLALFGGSPLVASHENLKINWPKVSAKDRDAVIAAFDRADFSGRSSSEVAALESEMAEYFGMPFGTAVNSGTAALHAALFSLGIKMGDDVIVPNLAFIATALAVVQSGARPIFADIEINSYNICIETILRVLTEKTKAVIVVHMHGIPVDLDPILEFCSARNIYVIEDVAQAPGAKYKGKLLGSLGDCSTFSLMSQKNLATCGECGVLLSKDERQKNRAEMLRIYGEIIRPNVPRVYNSLTWGWNYTLNPIQAAMARTQLMQFRSITKEIQDRGVEFNRKLAEFDWLKPPSYDEEYESVFHFYRVRMLPRPEWSIDSGRFRKAIQDALNAEGLNVRHYQNCPLSMQPIFTTMDFGPSLPTIEQMAGALDVLRTTLVLGAIGSSPAYLLKDGTIDAYKCGFMKIETNMGAILEYARSLSYKEPWESMPVTSDSFGAQYLTLDA